MDVTMKQIDTGLTLCIIKYKYTFVLSITHLLRSISKAPIIHYFV